MDLNLLTASLAGLGIGSVFTASVQYFLKKREPNFLRQREALESRYQVVILLMYAAYDWDRNQNAMRIQRPDLSSQKDVFDDLRAEWINMLLFASMQTQIELQNFVAEPTLQNLKDPRWLCAEI